MGGKEVLLKAVAQSLSVFAMPVFNIPKKICKGITDAIAQYWWGDDVNNKKLHWFAGGNCVHPRRKEDSAFVIHTVLI